MHTPLLTRSSQIQNQNTNTIMTVQSWLSIDEPSVSTSSSSSSSSTSDSLESNLSLQTLPSVPSLQHSSDHLNSLSVTHLCLSSIKSDGPVTSLTLHSGLLFAASGHQISAYDPTAQTLLHTFTTRTPSSGSVKSLAVSNGKILTAHQDSKIRVWKTTSYKMLTSLPTVNDRLRRFALPRNYVSVRRHKRVLWIEHADAVTGLAVNSGLGLIYSVSWDKTLKIWREKDLRCVQSVKAHDDAVNAVAVSPDGTVYTGSADRRIRIWARRSGEKRHALVSTLERHRSAVNALALTDDGSVLFSGSCDRSILVWEREDSASYMAVTGALRGHDKAVLGLIHVSGFLFSGSADRTVRIWRKARDEKYCCLTVLAGHEKPVRSLAAVWEGNKEGNGVVSVTSGSLDGEVKVWRVSVSNTASDKICEN